MLYHLTHLFARGLSERLLLAYYDTPLRDLIETEIAVNVTPRDQAEAVLAALLDSVAPMPEEK